MAGSFELFVDEDARIRFRLVMPDGRVLAVSGQYPDKHQAAAAIKDVRECAGTGLISDTGPAAARGRESGAATRTGRSIPAGLVPLVPPSEAVAP
ncbi:YegP family protein [Pseudarthrobacter siccitolerans]